MLNIKRSFQITTLILCTGISYVGAREALEYSLNFEKRIIKNKKKEDKQLLTLSEAFGNFIGRNLKNPGIEFDLERFIRGIREGAHGKPSPLSDEDYELLMATYQEKAFAELSEGNLNDANTFLKYNLFNENVVEIESGKLQYEILHEGDGDVVSPVATPLIHFTGKLMDGTTFGTTEVTGEPASIPLTGTITGFQKGITGMRQGEKRRLYIHPDYGYGNSGNLPPNTLLIFDIEVVKANNPETEADPISYNDDINEVEEHLSVENEELETFETGYVDTDKAPPIEQEAQHFEPEYTEIEEAPIVAEADSQASRYQSPPDNDEKLPAASEENESESFLEDNSNELDEEQIELDEAEFEEFDLLEEDFELPNW